jgi:hypothetical protein
VTDDGEDVHDVGRNELLFRPFRRAVTHNHHRADVVELFRDGVPFGSRYFEDLDAHPERALRHIGSPFTATVGAHPAAAIARRD